MCDNPKGHLWYDEFIMSRRDEIAEAALTLPPEDRAYIADLLEQSLPDQSGWSPEIAEAWSREIDRRVAAYDRGDTTGIDVETSLEHMRQALAQIRENRALYDSAVATYRQTVLTAFQQVEDDLATLDHLQTEYAQQEQAVADAEKSETLTLNQYKAGVADYASVLTAQTARLSSQITALNVQSQRLVASADLIEAMGGGWDSAQLRARNDGVSEPLKATVN